jgi:hypothetical protein
MRHLLTSLAILLSVATAAQRKDTLVKYFNAELEPVKKKEAVFVGVAVKDPFGWNAIIYNDSMKVIMRGKYENEDCTVKDGWFIYYNNKGERYLAGKYTKNQRTDLWQTWYPSGKPKDSIFFSNDIPQGPCSRYFASGILESSGFYRNGQLDSIWIWHHENGQVATKELYRGGRVHHLECFDSTGLSLGMNCALNRPPAIKGIYGGIEKYLSDSIRNPSKAPLDEMRSVAVEFIVYKSGSLSVPQILRSEDSLLEKEVLRAIRSIPAWYPAVSHNRNIDHTYNLLITLLPDNQGVMVQDNRNQFLKMAY